MLMTRVQLLCHGMDVFDDCGTDEHDKFTDGNIKISLTKIWFFLRPLRNPKKHLVSVESQKLGINIRFPWTHRSAHWGLGRSPF